MNKVLLLFSLFLFTNLYSQSFNNPDVWVTDRGVFSMAVDSDYTYIGGQFTYIGPNTGHGAKLVIGQVHPDMNFPNVNGTIYAAASDGNGGWYIGGSFTKVGNLTRNKVAHIDANGTITSWNPDISGSESYVKVIAVNGNYVYIGGYFYIVAGKTRNFLAKLDKTTGALDSLWNPSPNCLNVNHAINSIVFSGNDIYIGGIFDHISNHEAYSIAKINSTDAALDTTFKPYTGGFHWINSIVVNNEDIFIAGDIEWRESNIIKLNRYTGQEDTTWIFQANSEVLSLASDGNYIYAAGWFGEINSTRIYHLGRMNLATRELDTTWRPNVSDYINSVAVNADGVYIGGFFRSVNDQERNFIARINKLNGELDTGWDANANGGTVNIIAFDENNMYVGGSFFSLGGLKRNSLARVNNKTGIADPSWIANCDNWVRTIRIYGNDLYAGGDFTSVNGIPRMRLVKLNKWTGGIDASWKPEANSTVMTLDVNDNDVFLGGDFSKIGDSWRMKIAKVNNSDGVLDSIWNPEASNIVNDIVVKNNDVYAAGDFVTIGGQTRNRIAKLNGTTGLADTSWNPDASAAVAAICIAGNELYAGGWFDKMGGRLNKYFARLNLSTGKIDSAWSLYVNGVIHSIVSSDNDIVLGGYFNYLGSKYRPGVGKVNRFTGAVDPDFGPRISSEVYAVGALGNYILVGGTFVGVDDFPHPNLILFSNTISNVGEPHTQLPNNYSLYQNYPNPFNPNTTIAFNLPKDEKVSLRIYNILGEEVSLLLNEVISAGYHTINYNVKNLSSGVYLYRISAGSFNETKKMVILK